MCTCRGITLAGKPCHRKIKNNHYCFQHGIKTKFTQPKPSECVICCESLVNQKRALECGHWIHTGCVVASAKAECPLCRRKLQFGKRDTNRISKLAKQRYEEILQEEAEEIREEFVSESLRDRLRGVVENMMEENENISVNDVLMDQSFLDQIIGYMMAETDDESDY
jgi:hypothetical protein